MGNEFRDTEYGRISADFRVSKLEELCRVPSGIQTGPFGSQLHKDDYVSDGIPIITVEHLGNNRIIHEQLPMVGDDDYRRLERYRLAQNDIVFSRVGSVDRRALVRSAEAGWLFSGRCLRVRPDSTRIDARYLSYFFGLPEFQRHMRAIAVGATMPSLNTKILSKVNVYYPSIEKQRNIALILGALDDKIELNRRMNQTLESIAKAIFKSWFIDFDPVRAKAEDLDTGLCGELSSLFPDSLSSSEIGDVPTGWMVDSFTSTVEIIGGGTPKTSIDEYWNGHIPWFSVVDAPCESDVFVLDTEKQISEEGLKNSSARLLRTGTTIISARGTVGKVAIVGTPMAMNQSCYALKGKYVQGDYFTYYMTRQLVWSLKQQAHGSVFDTITRSTLESIECIRPLEDIVSAFDQMVAPLLEKVKSNLTEAGILSGLRNTLLPKLISGQIRIKDAEKFLERAL